MRIFDRVVCIHLERRHDRLFALHKALHDADWPFLPPEFFPGVDGSRLPVPDGWGSLPGVWGCRQSHQRVLERAILDDVQHLLVLEDDLCFRPGFRQKALQFLADVPCDFDGLLLGGLHMLAPTPVGEGVVRVRHALRSHAYSCRPAYMRRLYSALAGLWHDLWQNDAPISLLHRQHKVYAMSPFLIGQTNSPTDAPMEQLTEPENYGDVVGGRCGPLPEPPD